MDRDEDDLDIAPSKMHERQKRAANEIQKAMESIYDGELCLVTQATRMEQKKRAYNASEIRYFRDGKLARRR